MRKGSLRLGAMAVLFACGMAANARAETIVEVEGNDTLAKAQSVDWRFSLGDNPEVTNPTTLQWVSVSGGYSHPGDYDVFKFTTGGGGAMGTFDIDHGMPDLDSWIQLFDSNGELVAEADDSAIDAGSTHRYDSRIDYKFLTPGTYYIGVGQFPYAGALGVGTDYVLHISLTDGLIGPAPVVTDGSVPAVPTPAAVGGGLALLGVLAAKGRGRV